MSVNRMCRIRLVKFAALIPLLSATAHSHPQSPSFRWSCDSDLFTWGTCIDQHRGFSISTGDLDGDGDPDIVAGGGFASPGWVDVIRTDLPSTMTLVRRYSGIICNIPKQPSQPWQFENDYTDGVTWGITVACVGNLDQDAQGKQDIVIGEPFFDNGRGRILIDFNVDLTGTVSDCATGTINVYGNHDLKVIEGQVARGWFGWSLATATFDTTPCGAVPTPKPCLLVGAPGDGHPVPWPSGSPLVGAVFAHVGTDLAAGSTTPFETASLGVAGDRFGFSIARIGDLNGDDSDEIAASSVQARNQEDLSIYLEQDWEYVSELGAEDVGGKVRVMTLKCTGGSPDLTTLFRPIEKPSSGVPWTEPPRFGFSIAATRGQSESNFKLLVGSPGWKNVADAHAAGAALVYALSATGETPASFNPIVPPSTYGAYEKSYFGWAVHGNDFDLDGKGDLQVSASRYLFGSGSTYPTSCSPVPIPADIVGRVHLYRLLSSSATLTDIYTGEWNKPRFGWSLDSALFNSGSYPDLVAGLPGANLNAEVGKVVVFYR